MVQPPPIAAISQPIVQTVGAALPELDRRRRDDIAAPVRRSRHGAAGELRGRVGDRRLQHLAPGDDAALRRRPRAELAVERPRREVGVAGRARGARRRPGHPDLALELGPEEHQARRRARVELRRLGALVVGVEGEPVGGHVLQQHDARVGRPVGRRWWPASSPWRRAARRGSPRRASAGTGRSDRDRRRPRTAPGRGSRGAGRQSTSSRLLTGRYHFDPRAEVAPVAAGRIDLDRDEAGRASRGPARSPRRRSPAAPAPVPASRPAGRASGSSRAWPAAAGSVAARCAPAG